MSKNIKFLLCLVFLFFFMCFNVSAKTVKKARIDYTNVNLRTGPGTGYDSIRQLAVNSRYLLVTETKSAKSKGCSTGWYQIYYSKDKKGYACADFITVVSEEEKVYSPKTECEIALNAAGFPESYWEGLCALKSKYPNWTFEADKNGLDWNTTVEKESVDGKSYIQTSEQGYRSTSVGSYDYLNDTFKVKEGTNWYNANSKVVAYYLDPRNWFSEKYIFQFEKLSYDETYQTDESVATIVAGRDIASKVSVIMEAAKTYNANALYLAAKIVQETGGKFSGCALSGKSKTVNGVYYEHLYNAYNIGAFGGCDAGISWAGSSTSYLRPWTTIEKAILGGAMFISSDYINAGQDTGYYQKFMTSSYAGYASYSHQYMQNVQAAASEGGQTYNGYAEYSMLSSVNYKFVIPVYENMPNEKAALPNKGNPNNHLKSLKINGEEIAGFSHDKYEYNYYLGIGSPSVDIAATVINSNAYALGTGKVELKGLENNVTIKVTAQNGEVQNYVIKIIKTDGVDLSVKELIESSKIPLSENHLLLTAGYNVEKLLSEMKKMSSLAKVTVKNKISGNLVTGDEVTIENGGSKETYNIVIKGDPSGDGNINIQDLLKVQKFILGYKELVGSYQKAADVNNDGVIDILDLLKVQKHILGYLTIS